jgi:transcription factor AP-1
MSKRNNLTLDLKPAVPAVSAGGGPGGGATFVPASGIAPSKKARLRTAPEILTSPDVQMLKLTSPQLAEFLTRNPSLATPTPSGGYQFPTTVTAEQELYVRGFEEALKNKHASAQQGTNSGAGANTPAQILAIEKATAAYKQHQQQQASLPATSLPVTIQQQVLPTTIASAAVPTIAISSAASTVSELSSTNSRPSSSASGSYDDSASDYLPTVVVKQEPEADNNVSYAPVATRTTKGKGRKNSSHVRGVGISPIDMESQEIIKLERKRLRNRLAASKCRKRKLERISNLDEKVADLKDENGELMGIVKRLKESICNLKQEVMEHVQHGCQINMVVSQGST